MQAIHAMVPPQTRASWDKKPCACVGAALRKASISPPRSKTAAAPIPEPMHMDTTPKRAALPRLRISCSSVAVARAPAAQPCPSSARPEHPRNHSAWAAKQQDKEHPTQAHNVPNLTAPASSQRSGRDAAPA